MLDFSDEWSLKHLMIYRRKNISAFWSTTKKKKDKLMCNPSCRLNTSQTYNHFERETIMSDIEPL